MDRLQKNNKSVGEMEFLRFVFSIIIVLHHSRNFVGNKSSLFLNGAFAVEFFFILSGFLMMKSIRKIQTDSQNLGAETARFIKRNICRYVPT
ncbi:MAG: acyltransferase [Clostridia bacterium]|nr:acyltransferase [Clostridia bacterium]